MRPTAAATEIGKPALSTVAGVRGLKPANVTFKKPLKCRANSHWITRHLGARDFSRASCQATEMQLRVGWLYPIGRSDPCPANRCSSVALDGLRGPAGMRTYTRSRRTRPGHPAPAPLRYSSHGGCCIEEVRENRGKDNHRARARRYRPGPSRVDLSPARQCGLTSQERGRLSASGAQ
jgi:hypothetical protein